MNKDQYNDESENLLHLQFRQIQDINIVEGQDEQQEREGNSDTVSTLLTFRSEQSQENNSTSIFENLNMLDEVEQKNQLQSWIAKIKEMATQNLQTKKIRLKQKQASQKARFQNQATSIISFKKWQKKNIN
ncbi:UNKNOWN [Stylonychia lemnae]|uniref:Uncharacterized protein n=1 Tax=Stylonychia lemnae TaxID=5949 RepID=A0A078ANC1_STYLE|nr:UNKNOWN [Stylonychia lemnae]|eukprot:CDW82438.1 UNKNOWN [Stylonychia lemnae]